MLPPLTTLLFPVFCRTVLELGLFRLLPLKPARNGRLLLLTIPLMLFSGTPPVTGKTWLLGVEKGTTLALEEATIPVTTLLVAWDPPMMSCMKKLIVGCSAPVLVAGTLPATVADPPLGVATGVVTPVATTGLVTGGDGMEGLTSGAGAMVVGVSSVGRSGVGST